MFIIDSGCQSLSDNSVLFISPPPQSIALSLGGEDKSLVLLLRSLLSFICSFFPTLYFSCFIHSAFLIPKSIRCHNSSQKKLLPPARDLVDLSSFLIVNIPGHLQGFRFKENRNIQGISKSSLRAECGGHKTHCSPVKQVA